MCAIESMTVLDRFQLRLTFVAALTLVSVATAHAREQSETVELVDQLDSELDSLFAEHAVVSKAQRHHAENFHLLEEDDWDDDLHERLYLCGHMEPKVLSKSKVIGRVLGFITPILTCGLSTAALAIVDAYNKEFDKAGDRLLGFIPIYGKIRTVAGFINSAAEYLASHGYLTTACAFCLVALYRRVVNGSALPSRAAKVLSPERGPISRGGKSIPGFQEQCIKSLGMEPREGVGTGEDTSLASLRELIKNLLAVLVNPKVQLAAYIQNKLQDVKVPTVGDINSMLANPEQFLQEQRDQLQRIEGLSEEEIEARMAAEKKQIDVLRSKLTELGGDVPSLVYQLQDEQAGARARIINVVLTTSMAAASPISSCARALSADECPCVSPDLKMPWDYVHETVDEPGW